MVKLGTPVLDNETERRLLEEAERLGLSPEALAGQLIHRGLARVRAEARHDLDHLAGTWSPAEVEAFRRAVEPFEVIDEALWDDRRSA